MPRKSAAALAVVAHLKDHRPSPPETLTDEQASEWLAITRRLPGDFFPRECHRVLEAYCKHTTSFLVLSASIDEFQPVWLGTDEGLKRYSDLLALREREGRALSSLATRLRITPQSRYHQKTAATAASKVGADQGKPWEKSR